MVHLSIYKFSVSFKIILLFNSAVLNLHYPTLEDVKFCGIYSYTLYYSNIPHPHILKVCPTKNPKLNPINVFPNNTKYQMNILGRNRLDPNLNKASTSITYTKKTPK